MTSNKKLILFDIDNTLVKNSTLHGHSIAMAIERVTGFSIDLDEIRKSAKLNFHGNTDRRILEDILNFLGISSDSLMIDSCIEITSEHYSVNIHKETAVAVEGAAQALDQLHSIFKLGLVTGNIESVAWNKLRHTKLDGHFETGGFGSDHRERSELVKIAIDRCRKIYRQDFTNRTYVVGDTPRDIDAAKKAGTFSIGMATGSFTRDDLAKCNPDIVIGDYSETDRMLSFIAALAD